MAGLGALGCFFAILAIPVLLIIVAIGALITGAFKQVAGMKVAPKIAIPENSLELDVVGESHYQKAIVAVCGGQTEEGEHDTTFSARLVPEADNPYDSNAVHLEIKGKKVGYLAREVAANFRKIHGAASVNCVACINGGWKGGGFYGIKVSVPRNGGKNA